MSNVFTIPNEFVSRFYDDNNTGLADYRDNFMRDRDRVLYCTAFRRLSGKTQIYTIGNDDHKRNRMTHSLEVAQIARTIARALDLSEDLAEAIALGHDLGHTPFGHAGEQMLNEIMFYDSKVVKHSPFYHKSDYDIENYNKLAEARLINYFDKNSMYGFKHNLQSVRVAVVLEDSYRDINGANIGLNLTNYTLWGIQNHSNAFFRDSNLKPNYQNRFADMLSISNNESEAWSFEGYIVKIADDIAQWHHDLEDAIRGHAMPIGEICDTIIIALDKKLTNDEKEILAKNHDIPLIDRKCISELSHIVINTLVTDIITQSKANLEKIKSELANRFPQKEQSDISKEIYSRYDTLELPLDKKDIISFSNELNTDGFEKTIRCSVHHSCDVERMNEKGKYIIRKIFEAYCSHPQQLPDGAILHFMVDIGKYKNIDEAKSKAIGTVRTEFYNIMTEKNNPPYIYRCILMRRICDHVASMTDRYAIEEYNSLY